MFIKYTKNFYEMNYGLYYSIICFFYKIQFIFYWINSILLLSFYSHSLLSKSMLSAKPMCTWLFKFVSEEIESIIMLFKEILSLKFSFSRNFIFESSCSRSFSRCSSLTFSCSRSFFRSSFIFSLSISRFITPKNKI
jgi:hypothetical protein